MVAVAFLVVPVLELLRCRRKVGTLGAPSTSSWMVAIMEGKQFDIKMALM
jgi:hypothetical protein